MNFFENNLFFFPKNNFFILNTLKKVFFLNFEYFLKSNNYFLSLYGILNFNLLKNFNLIKNKSNFNLFKNYNNVFYNFFFFKNFYFLNIYDRFLKNKLTISNFFCFTNNKNICSFYFSFKIFKIEYRINKFIYNIFLNNIIKKIYINNFNNIIFLLFNFSNMSLLCYFDYLFFWNLIFSNFKKNDIVRNKNKTETGSLFKIISLAVLLESNSNFVDKYFFCENCYYFLNKYFIKDFKKNGIINLKTIFQKSSNIGILKIMNFINLENFFYFIKKIDFFSSFNFKKINSNSLFFGYQVNYNIYFLSSFIYSIINNGNILSPRIIFRIIDLNNYVYNNFDNKRYFVVKKETSIFVKSILKTTTNYRGTSYIKGNFKNFSRASKTGTINKFDKEKWNYSNFFNNSLYIGIFPFLKSEFLLTLMIENPDNNSFSSLVISPFLNKFLLYLLNLKYNFNEIKIFVKKY